MGWHYHRTKMAADGLLGEGLRADEGGSYLTAAGTIHAHRQHAVDGVPGRQSRKEIVKTDSYNRAGGIVSNGNPDPGIV